MNQPNHHQIATYLTDHALSELVKYVMEDTGCSVELRLNDGISDILSLRLLCADEAQAKSIERNFRRHAEDSYQKIVKILSEEE